MGKITEIRYNNNYTKAKIFVNGQFFCELTDEAIALRGLKVGLEIEDEQLDSAIYDSQVRIGFNWLTAYLSNYPTSKKRCVAKLAEKGYSQDVINSIVKKAEEYKYINDNQLAIELATLYLSRGSMRQARDKMLRMELPVSLINSALKNLGEDAEAMSAKAVASVWCQYKDLADRSTKEKYFRYMSGKGYAFAVANSVLKQIMEEDDED